MIDDIGSDASTDHMRTDVELLEQVVADGQPALRLYTWSEPTLSLGRFQDRADVDEAACEELGVRIVRRPTGGAALLHGADLTYSVSLSLPSGADGGVRAVYDVIARALIAGLELIGVTAAIARNDGPPGAVCFAGQQGADLRVGDRKVCGSAQVRRDGAVLQHGSILLRRLEIDECDVVRTDCDHDALLRATVTLEELAAPSDPRSVADAIVKGFARSLPVSFDPAVLVPQRSYAQH
ncbi:MAG: biotin/lipoate A/B protein ligase family protein [Acidimicrobiia bacterium]